MSQPIHQERRLEPHERPCPVRVDGGLVHLERTGDCLAETGLLTRRLVERCHQLSAGVDACLDALGEVAGSVCTLSSEISHIALPPKPGCMTIVVEAP